MALSGWNSNNRLKLVLDGSKINENTLNFPVSVVLSSGTGINNYDPSLVFDELNNNTDIDSYTELLLHTDIWDKSGNDRTAII